MLNKLLLRLIYSSSKPQNFKYIITLKMKILSNLSLQLMAFTLPPNSGRKSGPQNHTDAPSRWMVIEPRSVANQNLIETATFGNQDVTVTGIFSLPSQRSALFRSLEDVLSLNIPFHSSSYLAGSGRCERWQCICNSFFLLSISFSVTRVYSKPSLVFLNHHNLSHFAKTPTPHAI